jgi:hypothetical protein
MGIRSKFGGIFDISWTIPKGDMLKKKIELGRKFEMGEFKHRFKGKKTIIDHVPIHQTLGILTLGRNNKLLKDVQIILKRTISPNPFMENEQWNVVCMKEEFHP